MNRHERRKQEATSQGATDELHDILGNMLAISAPKIRAESEAWIRDGHDVADLAIVIGVKGDGRGAVIAKSRRELAVELTRAANEMKSVDLSNVGIDLFEGKAGCIPAVFWFVDLPNVPAIHLTWLDPIDPAAVH